MDGPLVFIPMQNRSSSGAIVRYALSGEIHSSLSFPDVFPKSTILMLIVVGFIITLPNFMSLCATLEGRFLMRRKKRKRFKIDGLKSQIGEILTLKF